MVGSIRNNLNTPFALGNEAIGAPPSAITGPEGTKTEMPVQLPDVQTGRSGENQTVRPQAGGSDTLDLDAALNRLEELQKASLSPELINSLLGKLMIEQAASQRHTALQDRMTSRQAAKADLMDQASSMDKAADEMMKGAIISLVMTVVSSAISIIGSVASLKNSLGGLGEKMEKATSAGNALEKSATDAGMAADEAKQLGARFSRDLLKSTVTQTDKAMVLLDKAGSAVGNLMAAAGQFGKSVTDADAKHIEAEGARSAAKAQDKQADADQSKEIQQALDEMLKAIINFLKELRETEANMMQAMTKV